MENRRNRWRRKEDKVLLGGAAIFVLLSVAFYAQSCSKGGGPTGPDPITVHDDVRVSTQSTSPETGTAPAETPEDDGKNPGPTSVVCSKSGQCTFSNSGKAQHGVNAVCTDPGQNNNLGSVSFVVPPGENTYSIHVRDICDPKLLEIDLCEGGSKKVQVDFNSGGHIGHWGLGEGLRVVYEPNEEYCECEPTDRRIIRRGEPYRGEQIECPVQASNNVEACYECYEQKVDVVWSNGCEERGDTITLDEPIRVEVECPCAEQWIPDEEFTETRRETSECSLGVKTTTVYGTKYETNSCSQETREWESGEQVIDTFEEDCPVDGLCYYKVSGNSEVVKEFICEHTFSLQSFNFGTWLNFDGSKLDNHCQYPVPGIVNRIFQLTPGQSDPGCLNKND